MVLLLCHHSSHFPQVLHALRQDLHDLLEEVRLGFRQTLLLAVFAGHGALFRPTERTPEPWTTTPGPTTTPPPWVTGTSAAIVSEATLAAVGGVAAILTALPLVAVNSFPGFEEITPRP